MADKQTQPAEKQTKKGYDPQAIEQESYNFWIDGGYYHAEPDAPGQPYCIVIPPPNVTDRLHLGHGLNNTIQDILTRWRRMAGDNAVWIPGTDHAGIATQTVVEKRVLAQEGKKRTDYKREEFVAKIQAWKDEYEQTILGQLKAMGCSCDWDRTRFTMDPVCARAVREAFFLLFKDGLIYRGKRLVNWDPATQTALADDEVEMEEIDGHFWYLRYPLVEPVDYQGQKIEHVTVATTRPETMLGDTAVAMNPADPRIAALKGKMVRLPIVNRVVPIIADEYVVLPNPESEDAKAKYASGFLKVTPAHDPNDYDIGRRHNLPLVNILAPDGSISEKFGWPEDDLKPADPFLMRILGKDRFEARKMVVGFFKENGLLEEVKPYRHSVGHSYRSHVPVEPYLSDQWYVKVTDDRLAGRALRAMAKDQRSTSAPDSTSRDREGAGGANLPTNQARKDSSPPAVNVAAYFITYTCYGQWLHGDQRGSVDLLHNLPGTPYLTGDEARERREFDALKNPPMVLDAPARTTVHQAIQEVCRYRNWTLLALQVRPTHVHAIVVADEQPEKVMNAFKSYATRGMRDAGLITDDARVWTRHGSTRYLKDDLAVDAACQYVINEQGASTEPAPFDGRKTPLPHGRGSSVPFAPSWEGQLRFTPERYAKTFQMWHENLRDWCISRQLWWGHRIPVWSREDLAATDTGKLQILIGQDRVAAQEIGGAHYLCVRGDQDHEAVELLESLGYVQDPDVLDTWFSSALWPISTLGWPEPSKFPNIFPQGDLALKTWNPSNTLSTAREIITLWVSRMVMFNLYFRDCLPFYNVFIHAMIQDGEGRKMSKSLGNGVDPLDIIHSHGADAMRFTLASMTTQTQDVRMPVEKDPATGRNTSPKFDIGRNFSNKIWQASTGLAIPNLEGYDPQPLQYASLPLEDRWILSRLQTAIQTIEKNLSGFQFADAAQETYRFFWNELCDWYLEMVKPRLRAEPPVKRVAQQVLAWVLDQSLRLLHPFMPFLTEGLWKRLNEVAHKRGIETACEQGTALIRAAWPTVSASWQNAGVETQMARLQEVIRALRDAVTRVNERRSAQKQPVLRNLPLAVIRADAELAGLLDQQRETFGRLGRVEQVQCGTDVTKPAGSMSFVVAGTEVFVPVADLIDSAIEKGRLEQEIEKAEKMLVGVNAKLADEKFTGKAPPNVVQVQRDRQKTLAEQIETLRKHLAELARM